MNLDMNAIGVTFGVYLLAICAVASIWRYRAVNKKSPAE